MFRNYFKTAWRNLVTNKVYSALNILGLATGMGVALIIGLWVFYQYSYDIAPGCFKIVSEHIFKFLSMVNGQLSIRLFVVGEPIHNSPLTIHVIIPFSNSSLGSQLPL